MNRQAKSVKFEPPEEPSQDGEKDDASPGEIVRQDVSSFQSSREFDLGELKVCR